MTDELEKKKRWVRYPICPECGHDTVVLFSPPKEPVDFEKIGEQEYIDWYKAHLYCCNATTNCKWEARIIDLCTPQRKKL